MTHTLSPRPWLPPEAESRVAAVSAGTASMSPIDLQHEVERLAAENHRIHDRDCLNLNPATNVMNPRAEALLAANLGSRPSLGYPGEKYEMGLEAIEQIEVIAAELAARGLRRRLRGGPRRFGRAGQPLHVHGHLRAR